jgi:hypothetical protein
MKRRILPLSSLFLLALAVGAAFAQSAPAPAKPAAPPASQSAQQPAPPQITEVQRLTLENLQLKASLLQQQQQALQTQFGDLLRAINAAHPGWLFNPNTAQFQPAPATPKTAATPAAKTASEPKK